MKIKNSRIYFKNRVANAKSVNVKDVPYWSLYSRKGDDLQEAIGKQWRSPMVFTYDEIIDYLNIYQGSRKLTAYPRFSKHTRRSFTLSYDKHDHMFVVMDKYTGVVHCMIDANTAKVKYLSRDYKSGTQFVKKFFYKNADNSLGLHWNASRLIAEENELC